jgi:type IV secretion system protein VirD4
MTFSDFYDAVRNTMFFIAMALGVLVFTFCLSGVVFISLIWGPSHIPLDETILTEFLWARGIQFWWIYRTQITWQYGDYYLVKLLVSLATPILFFSWLGYFLRGPLYDLRPFKKPESIHGDAKWASQKEIKKAGLRSKNGLLLGKDEKGYFIAGGFQHALLFAPTGSGKGVGFVIPNLLYWKDSVLVHDIKLENYDLTSGYRASKLKQKVFVWAPADPDGLTHCYNPIDWVSDKPGQMVDDVQKIANLIMPEKEFWNNEARTLFVGVVLYLLAVPEKTKSFGEVVRTMRSDDVVYNLAVVLDTIGKQIHPVAYMNIAAFLQKADKERSGVISTMNSSLELWANPLIDTATASSDFNIKNFKREKVTVYVGLTPDNIQRLEPLMKVFYQQATEFLTRKIPQKDEPHGVLFVMDEFPTLGKMEQFQTGIAYFRGYNVRLFLIIQDTEQLKGIYEEAGMNSFLSNSTYRITFAANNMETANLISQLCGNKTVEQESLNKPKFFDLNPAARSLHVSKAQRALLLPQEVITLPRDEQIVLIESCSPIKSKKIRYFEDRLFKKRLLKPITIPQQEPYDPRRPNPTETNNTEQNQSDDTDNDFMPSLPPPPNFDDDDEDFSIPPSFMAPDSDYAAPPPSLEEESQHINHDVQSDDKDNNEESDDWLFGDQQQEDMLADEEVNHHEENEHQALLEAYRKQLLEQQEWLDESIEEDANDSSSSNNSESLPDTEGEDTPR